MITFIMKHIILCFIMNIIITGQKFSANPIYLSFSAIARILLKQEFKPKYIY